MYLTYNGVIITLTFLEKNVIKTKLIEYYILYLYLHLMYIYLCIQNVSQRRQNFTG